MSLPRPSAAGRWVMCPGSVLLEEPIPEDQGEDAKEGVAAHWAGAHVLGGHAELEELTDRQAPNGVIITGDMAEHIEFYVDTVRNGAGGNPVVVERTMPIAPGVQDGTPDAYRVEGLTAFLWDFKYGYGIVEAVNNWQLACYAVGLFIRHEWKLQNVLAHIVQPRAHHWQGHIRSWNISNAEGIKLYQMLERTAALTQAPGAVTTTGPHCQHCRAVGTCEAAQRASLNAIDVSTRGTRQALTGTDVAREMETLRRGYAMIKARLDAVEETAKSILGGGGIVPGWSEQPSFGHRIFKDDASVAALEVLTGQTLTVTKPLTPAKAEKLPGVGKDLVAQFTTRPSRGRKLVPVDVSAVAKEVFK